ncbi:hypothetical protein TrVE_jg11735 [Triparma verrucosa]|uniref:Uncharacterized protein n=1 Tax=Triparma verrucosa TaxID=1606542 RepID=A0A9W7CNN3_9STRA|nr:hypothetical protein TrVE_jg11735 [Triparma verrucosa]
MADNIYWESYLKVLNVLETAGAVFEETEGGRRRLKKRLRDEDICRSVIDGGEEDDDDDDEENLGLFIMSGRAESKTVQLNILSNVVRRSLLFGSDEELTILSETLTSTKKDFAEKWYPSTSLDSIDSIPSVQYLNALILLCSTAVSSGTITTVEPLTPLNSSYTNSYYRLLGNLLSLGSGYISTPKPTSPPRLPKTPTEELGRFVKWESAFRSTLDSRRPSTPHPSDLCGPWSVTDEVGGLKIGVSSVTLLPSGAVSVPNGNAEGLTWRLDPGPTHLDTLTFRAFDSSKILEYKGYLDRGARLEARVSKRCLKVRGKCTSNMRGEESGGEEIGTLYYSQATTRFVMEKVKEEGGEGGGEGS